jgi:hypothetical protein
VHVTVYDGSGIRRPSEEQPLEKSTIQETLVSLYLRLNGYFVSGFIVHAPRRVRTEMDVLGVRFPQHKEPEREVLPDYRLCIPAAHIDFVIGEVKGGPGNVNFNTCFRSDEGAIRTVMQRFGAFDDSEIDRVCRTVSDVLDPRRLRQSNSFPELEISLCEACGKQKAKLRFVPFAAEQRRAEKPNRPYVFEDDMLDFIWRCFRPIQQRDECDTRYDFGHWGTQFAELVKYFKDTARAEPGGIQDIYQFMNANG